MIRRGQSKTTANKQGVHTPVEPRPTEEDEQSVDNETPGGTETPDETPERQQSVEASLQAMLTQLANMQAEMDRQRDEHEREREAAEARVRSMQEESQKQLALLKERLEHATLQQPQPPPDARPTKQEVLIKVNLKRDLRKLESRSDFWRWFFEIKDAAEAGKWPYSYGSAAIDSSLDQNYRQLYARICKTHPKDQEPTIVGDLEELRRQLGYPDNGSAEQLVEFKQKEGEHIVVYGAVLQNVIQAHFQHLSANEQIRIFMRGLRMSDEKKTLILGNAEPKTLEEVIKHFASLEGKAERFGIGKATVMTIRSTEHLAKVQMAQVTEPQPGNEGAQTDVQPRQEMTSSPSTMESQIAALIQEVREAKTVQERGQMTCFRCGQPGHRARECPQTPRTPSNGTSGTRDNNNNGQQVRALASRQAHVPYQSRTLHQDHKPSMKRTCQHCGESGHPEWECSIPCPKCDGYGHEVKFCPDPVKGLVCKRCQGKGHTADSCANHRPARPGGAPSSN